MNMKNDQQDYITVGFVALGCPKNLVDAEVMLARIGQAGFMISNDPDSADVVIINTCGFIEPAKAEAIDAIRQAVRQKKKKCVRKVIVTGCLSERMGESLLNKVPEIDAIVGLAERDNIYKIIEETLGKGKKQPAGLYLEKGEKIHDDRGRLLITPEHWAYLRISEGCNRKCSFCTIPAIRGKFRSKPMELILDEANELVANGAKELSLIAQDSNFYGRDMGIENGLVKIINEMEKIDALQWLRLMYLYPAGIDDALIETIAKSDKVVNYVDIPLQHINNDILKSMRRSDTKENTLSLIEKFRAAIPDVVLRTTPIVGYPGETDQQFNELMEFIEWAKFYALGCFTFYPEKGTPAAELPGQIAEQVKNERAEALMLKQQEIAFAKADALVGKKLKVMVEQLDDEESLGRYYGQAPHIDSLCIIENCTASPGDIIETKVIGRTDYDLIVKQ